MAIKTRLQSLVFMFLGKIQGSKMTYKHFKGVTISTSYTLFQVDDRAIYGV